MNQSANALEKPESSRQQSLEAAFAFFNETSEQLARSYRALEARVQELSAELDRTQAARDVENQKNHALESRMQALLDFLPGGVVVLDARGHVVESNPAAERLLGTDPQNKIWRHIIGECFAPKNDDGLEVSTRHGKRLSISTSSLGSEGQIILLTDQTETRRLQEHVSRHEKLSAMGKMVSALAHQIRTPLSAAILYAGHLTDDELEASTRSRFAHKCLGRLQHMEKQVRDMMLFVKSELPLNDQLSPADLILDLQAASEVALQTSSAHCEWPQSLPSGQLKCHRAALVSALMNLINNAIQSGPQPRIRIEVTPDIQDGDSVLRLNVIDNGAGMDADTLARVQEMFTTTKAQGTGLGLAVVRSVARAHGAAFSLTSKPGQGTCASLLFPLAAESASVSNVEVEDE